jgi:two-component system OmpR family sensor kinase/two-component system sensor histidine kinase BaeS
MDWQGDRPLPPWLRHRKAEGRRHPSGGVLFFRFAVIFGLFVLVGCGIMAALAAAVLLFFRQSGTSNPPGLMLLLLGVIFVLLLVLGLVGSMATRRFTSPLSETMKAADALANGDLSARVPVEGSGEFRRFARSFNYMAQALESTDQRRRELLADVAHELRTPLSVIQGNLEGLRDGVYEATPEQMDLVLDETRKLSRLVDDLRLLTLAEAGELPLDLRILDAHQLLVDVREAFSSQAREAHIALTVDRIEPTPDILADPQRLGQVLGNLLTNALQHTPGGGSVTLGAAREPSGEAVRLWVTDTGEGISAEDLSRIFDRFWRGDRSRSHETGASSGLGLAIAKSLVEAHGGRIWAESEIGAGTTVSCILPLPPAA